MFHVSISQLLDTLLLNPSSYEEITKIYGLVQHFAVAEPETVPTFLDSWIQFYKHQENEKKNDVFFLSAFGILLITRGQFFQMEDKYSKALDYYEQSFKCVSSGYALDPPNFGNFYCKCVAAVLLLRHVLPRRIKVDDWLPKLLEVATAHKSDYGLAIAHCELAEEFRIQRKYAETLQHLTVAMKHATSANMQPLLDRVNTGYVLYYTVVEDKRKKKFYEQKVQNSFYLVRSPTDAVFHELGVQATNIIKSLTGIQEGKLFTTVKEMLSVYQKTLTMVAEEGLLDERTLLSYLLLLADSAMHVPDLYHEVKHWFLKTKEMVLDVYELFILNLLLFNYISTMQCKYEKFKGVDTWMLKQISEQVVQYVEENPKSWNQQGPWYLQALVLLTAVYQSQDRLDDAESILFESHAEIQKEMQALMKPGLEKEFAARIVYFKVLLARYQSILRAKQDAVGMLLRVEDIASLPLVNSIRNNVRDHCLPEELKKEDLFIIAKEAQASIVYFNFSRLDKVLTLDLIDILVVTGEAVHMKSIAINGRQLKQLIGMLKFHGDEYIVFSKEEVQIPNFLTAANVWQGTTSRMEMPNAFLSRPEQKKLALEELFNILIGPVHDLLIAAKSENLYIVPSDILYNVPWNALYDPKRRNHLIHQFAISVIPNLKCLWSYIQRRDKGTTQYQCSFGLMGLGKDIINTVEEVSTIQKIAAAENFQTVRLVSQQATKQNVLNLISSSDVIHLATHGHASPNDARLTSSLDSRGCLACWDDRIFGVDVEEAICGRATPSTSSKCPSLVFLNACEVASGKEQEGDFSLSILKSFLGAGIPSIIASFIPLADYVASTVGKKVFKLLCKDQKSSMQSLREVLIECMQERMSIDDLMGYIHVGIEFCIPYAARQKPGSCLYHAANV